LGPIESQICPQRQQQRLFIGVALWLPPVSAWSAAGHRRVTSESPPAAFSLSSLPELRHLPLRHRSYAEVVANMPPSLLAASHVYIRRGGMALPLAPPYRSPFHVISRSSKSFIIDVGGREIGGLNRPPQAPHQCCSPGARPAAEVSRPTALSLVPAHPAGPSPGPG